MNRDKQIEEMQQFVIDIQNSSQKATEIITQETANYVKQNHKYNNIVDYAKAHIKSRYEYEAEFLAELGYRKASAVAREIFEEIENAIDLLRKSVVEGRKNDGIKYQQLHDGRMLSLEALKYFIAQLKKKYESEKDK